MTWILASATVKGDACEIVYSETAQDEDGNNVVATRTAWHYRTSFAGKQQTIAQWKANIKGEIVAGLAGLNKTSPEPLDITAEFTT